MVAQRSWALLLVYAKVGVGGGGCRECGEAAAGGGSLWRKWRGVGMWVVLLSLQHVRWRSMCGHEFCLAHGGHSRCEAVVMKGGDSDGDGSGGKSMFVFVFGYEFCLVMSSSKDCLRLVRPVFCQSLNFRNRERPKTGLWLWSLMVLGISGLGQSWSSPVSVFFQSWDWTSKH
jgi:hypothetical protein